MVQGIPADKLRATPYKYNVSISRKPIGQRKRKNCCEDAHQENKSDISRSEIPEPGAHTQVI
jgi:hypothetical protein